MAQYAFKALTSDGKTISGTLEADSNEGAIAQLGRQGYYPISAQPVGSAPAGSAPRGRPVARGRGKRRKAASKSAPKRINARQRLILTRELGQMLRAGIAVEQAIGVVARTTTNEAMQSATRQISETLRAGQPLSDALETYGAPFDRFYVSIIRAGEAAGAVADALQELGDYLKRSADFASALRLALIYPSMLVLTTVISLAVILGFVVPQFEDMFSRAGSDLPGHTKLLLAFSGVIYSYGWLLLALGGLAVLLVLRMARTDAGQLRLHSLMLRLPMLGPLIRQSETVRLCRALGTMLKNGVSVTQAFDRVLPIIRNRYIARSFEDVRLALRAGRGFAEPLSQTDTVPENAIQMIRVGEETGRLDTMLLDVSNMLEQDIQDAMKRVLSILEPAIILTLGIIIGGIVLSIFLAVMGSYDLAI